MAFEFVSQNLAKRKAEHLFRELKVVESSNGAIIEVAGKHYLNFSSNDYLGQRQNPLVMQAYMQGVIDYGVGSGASPLVTGHSRAHQELQNYLANKLNYESALLFNSGYAANQAICQALTSQKVTVLADKLMHASFNEGARSHAHHFKRFRHNDCLHLKTLLEQTQGDCLVATEGVFSMDGDCAPLQQISALAQTKSAWLMVDDAHGFGMLGKEGLGSLEVQKVNNDQVAILMGTFGKAIGTSGAFIAASKDVIDYLINFARHYIYSTAMPAAQAVATLASITSLQDGQRQQQLQQNIELFKYLSDQQQLPLMSSNTAIQPVLVQGAKRCLKISEKLQALGIWVTAMRAPTVPKGQERLRVTLSASHQKQDIEALVDALSLSFQQTSQLS